MRRSLILVTAVLLPLLLLLVLVNILPSAAMAADTGAASPLAAPEESPAAVPDAAPISATTDEVDPTMEVSLVQGGGSSASDPQDSGPEPGILLGNRTLGDGKREEEWPEWALRWRLQSPEPVEETPMTVVKRPDPRFQQQPTIIYRRSNTSFQRPSTADNRPQTANTQQPATSNQQPTTSNQQPTTNYQQPTTNYQQPATNYQQPATSSQPLSTNAAYSITLSTLHRGTDSPASSSTFVFTNTGAIAADYNLDFYWLNGEHVGSDGPYNVAAGGDVNYDMDTAPFGESTFAGYVIISGDEPLIGNITSPDYGLFSGIIVEDDGVTPYPNGIVHINHYADDILFGGTNNMSDGRFYIGGLPDDDYALWASVSYPWAHQWYDRHRYHNERDNITISGAGETAPYSPAA